MLVWVKDWTIVIAGLGLELGWGLPMLKTGLGLDWTTFWAWSERLFIAPITKITVVIAMLKRP